MCRQQLPGYYELVYLVVGPLTTSDLVDSKADGEQLVAVAAVAAVILLHQSNQEAAGSFLVAGGVILLQQDDPVLRVVPECVCAENVSLPVWR